MNNAPQYIVTKQFTGGILKGLTHTELTTVRWSVGREVRKPIGNGSPYVIVAVEAVSK